MKTNIKRRTYQTKSRKNEKAKYKLLAAVSILAFTAIYFTAYAWEVLNPTSKIFPRATVVRAESKLVERLPETTKTIETVEQTIRRLAKEANFPWVNWLVKIANCESRLNPLATNNKGNTPKGSTDRGLFMFSDYWHKEVSDECAFSTECSTKKAIELTLKGRQHEFICNQVIKK